MGNYSLIVVKLLTYMNKINFILNTWSTEKPSIDSGWP